MMVCSLHNEECSVAYSQQSMYREESTLKNVEPFVIRTLNSCKG